MVCWVYSLESPRDIIANFAYNISKYLRSRAIGRISLGLKNEFESGVVKKNIPASSLYKSIAERYRPVSYPDGPITARYRFIKNAYWDRCSTNWGYTVQVSSRIVYLWEGT